jgi:hypothetical protein
LYFNVLLCGNASRPPVMTNGPVGENVREQYTRNRLRGPKWRLLPETSRASRRPGVLKVTAATFEALNFEVLRQKSGAPPEYCRS